MKTRRAYGGMTTAPHHLASEAGLAVLKDGGNAVEAMVAMAAAIAVVYPHMNSIGGDGFWLIADAGADVIGIDACGAAAGAADMAFYRERGFDAIPQRGPLAALPPGAGPPPRCRRTAPRIDLSPRCAPRGLPPAASSARRGSRSVATPPRATR